MRFVRIQLIGYAIGLFITAIFSLARCGTDAKASEPADIECKILNAWDFKRCENAEVVCYSNTDGMSCKFKETK